MTITVSGASDDLIEISGDITEEFGYIGDGLRNDGDLLAFSDGTVLRIRFADAWRITRVAAGTSAFTLQQHTGDDGTDTATLEAAEWVVHGTGMAKR